MSAEFNYGANIANKEIAYNEVVTYDYKNYPNPFNPTTTINYSIKNLGIVTLKVYNILGKEVAALLNEEKSSGRYEVSFNATSLASGVYLYRLSVNDPSISSGQNYVDVKKMILLK